jgi:hypothetical protein
VGELRNMKRNRLVQPTDQERFVTNAAAPSSVWTSAHERPDACKFRIGFPPAKRGQSVLRPPGCRANQISARRAGLAHPTAHSQRGPPGREHGLRTGRHILARSWRDRILYRNRRRFLHIRRTDIGRDIEGEAGLSPATGVTGTDQLQGGHPCIGLAYPRFWQPLFP